MISFEHLTRNSDPQLIEEVISCYQAVFADPPWSEWKKCGRCGKSWGKEKEDVLRKLRFMHCGQQVDEFWSRVKVMEGIQECFDKEGPLWIARSRTNVFGFCWGFETTLEGLEAKLEIQLPVNLSGVLGSDAAFRIGYQNELGVLMEFRGQGHAKELFKQRLKAFLERGVTTGFVRTRKSPKPSVTYSWFTKKLGYREIVDYPNGDGRVVLGRSLHGLYEIL